MLAALRPCASASPTTASSRGPWAAPSAGTATSPSGWPPTGTRSPTSRAGSGSRAIRREIPGVRVIAVSRADDALRAGRQPRDRPAAALRLGRAAPPAAPWTRLRRRPHGVVPLLLGARRGGRAAARRATGSSSTGSRSGAATTGATTSAPVGGARRPRGPAPAARACRSARSASRACYAARLVEEGLRGAPTVLGGLYAGSLDAAESAARPSRSSCSPAATSPEKRAPAVVAAIARARARGLDVRGADPRRRARSAPLVLAEIAAHGLEGIVEAPGLRRRRRGRRRRCAARSACCTRPRARATGSSSSRPPRTGRRRSSSRGPDNAAVELVEPGVNGFVAPSADPDDLADAIVAVHEAGPALRERTCAWFAENAERLSLEASLDAVAASYAAEASARA